MKAEKNGDIEGVDWGACQTIVIEILAALVLNTNTPITQPPNNTAKNIDISSEEPEAKISMKPQIEKNSASETLDWIRTLEAFDSIEKSARGF